MDWLFSFILGVIEGITEFLPVSSTGHLNIAEKLMGYEIDKPEVTAFTAVIQVGAILAAIVYFWSDIYRIAMAWFAGLARKDARTNPDYRLGWGVILGSVPVAVVGLTFKGAIETTVRSLWVIAIALVAWSVVMWLADRKTNLTKTMDDITVKDALLIGLFQALSPVLPGISRSGATISAGLFLGYDRVSATRLSFFMGIPALVAAGVLEAVTNADVISAPTNALGWGPTILATLVSFVVAYASIAWLLKFVSKNSFTSFIIYRVIVGVVMIGLLFGGVLTP